MFDSIAYSCLLSAESEPHSYRLVLRDSIMRNVRGQVIILLLHVTWKARLHYSFTAQIVYICTEDCGSTCKNSLDLSRISTQSNKIKFWHDSDVPQHKGSDRLPYACRTCLIKVLAQSWSRNYSVAVMLNEAKTSRSRPRPISGGWRQGWGQK